VNNKKAPIFTSESQLASCVVQYLTDDEWDVYQEVNPRSYGSTADIVATKGKLVWVIETKLTFSLQVLQQACNWLNRAHLVSVAVPQPKKHWSRRGDIGAEILKWKGVGLLEVFAELKHVYRSSFMVPEPDAPELSFEVREVVQPKLSRRAFAEIFTEVLCEEHKTFAKAGTNSGKRWTPWRQTIESVRSFVQSHNGCTLKELLEQCQTHYHSTSSARANLSHWIEAGKVEDVYSIRDGRYIRLFYGVKPEANRADLLENAPL
jgi:hypothetical protein